MEQESKVVRLDKDLPQKSTAEVITGASAEAQRVLKFPNGMILSVVI